MIRDIRYQAAILHEDRILLIQHREHASGRSYWLLPGGGREGDETPEQCLIREAHEETGLTITVQRLLLDDPAPPGDVYQRLQTYLCRPPTQPARARNPSRKPLRSTRFPLSPGFLLTMKPHGMRRCWQTASRRRSYVASAPPWRAYRGLDPEPWQTSGCWPEVDNLTSSHGP